MLTYDWGILMGSMLPYIAAPWILWVIFHGNKKVHHIGIGILIIWNGIGNDVL
jgi:hypothetical protein